MGRSIVIRIGADRSVIVGIVERLRVVDFVVRFGGEGFGSQLLHQLVKMISGND